MPLLKDKLNETKLRSLPFGNDRPDGGSSNQPYIQTPIDVNLGFEQGSVGYNVLGNDFLLRGGVLGATAASANDVARLTKFFNPFAKGAALNGALFVAKQAVLERQGVDVRDGRSRTYLPTNTVAQAGLNAFGIHLDKDGINPFKAGYYGEGDTGYYITTLNNSTGEFSNGSRNRLQLLYQVKRLGDDGTEIQKTRRKLQIGNIANQNILAAGALASIGTIGLLGTGLTNPLAFAGLGVLSSLPLLLGNVSLPKTTVNIKLASDLYGITNTNDVVNLISYEGGPGSFLGIGKTNIKIWNPLQFKNTPDIIVGSNIVKNEDQFSDPKLYLTPTDGNIVGAISVRESLLNTSKTSFSRKRNGQTKIFNPNLSISSDQQIPDDGDIINFYFELINNDNVSKNTKIPLRAYIEDFGDSFTGEWDSFKYMGRAENFYRYKGFTRDFNINFIVPTLSRTDLITNYQKLNALTWLTMPDYSDVGYIRGNLAYFTLGDYFQKAVIVMKSINFSPIMEMGFDINRDEEYELFSTDNDLYTGQLPKGIKVSCTMTPLTQMTKTGDNKESFYTPQRGEAFIGNRKHAIKDRPDTVGTQYGESETNDNKVTIPYVANDPEQSAIFKNS
jgi:hypothetical protein